MMPENSFILDVDKRWTNKNTFQMNKHKKRSEWKKAKQMKESEWELNGREKSKIKIWNQPSTDNKLSFDEE